MGLVKDILNRDDVRQALCWVGAQYIRFAHATSRWSVEGGDLPEAMWRDGRPFVLAFWHGRILMMPYCWRRGQPIHMLISQHRDGRLIAATVAHFGIDTVAGSSSRGGSSALRAMLKALKNGQCVGITPDGPRGPRMRASAGIVQVARMAGVPIVPCTFSASRRKVLGSWDRFVVALPFSKGIFLWGRPIQVAADASEAALAAATRAVEDELNALSAEADRRTGHVPIEPAERATSGEA